MKEFHDKQLICSQCGRTFTFSAAEQAFYDEKGFTNEPKRCPDDRAARKEAKQAARVLFDTVCTNCGQAAQVPFRPTEGRPTLCDECFTTSRVR